MSDWPTCLNWALDNEDPARQYKTVPDPPNEYQKDENGDFVLDAGGQKIRIGAFAICGINSAAYPVQFAEIKSFPQNLRAQPVATFYQVNFWNQWYAQIVSNEVAKRALDCAVLDGPETAVYILQRAVNGLGGAQIEEDGKWGPVTVAAINNQNSAMLVNSLQAQWLGHAQAVVDKNPALAKYLGTAQNPGPWWIRIMK